MAVDMARRKPGDPPKRQRKVRESGPNYCTSAECKWLAWRLYCEGTFAWKPLARAVNSRQHPEHPRCPNGPHNDHWAEMAVDFCGRATAEALEHDGPVQLAHCLQGCQADLQAQLGFATGANAHVKLRDEEGNESIEEVPDFGLRSLARTRVTDIRLKMAQLLGVVTERKGLEVTGKGGAAIQAEITSDIAIGVDDAASILAILDEVGALEAIAGSGDGDAEDDAVHPA